MMQDSEADDYQIFLRPPWESDEEIDLEPPRLRRTCQPKAEPDLQHPLLAPLARAQDALTRLETSADVASPAVAEGLRARMAYREASGWLTHTHLWIHPHDLALRDHALTDSYGVAFRAGRLNAEIPLTVASRSDFEVSPSDICVQQALQLARHWCRLAELRTWRPLANSGAVQETLQAFGYHGILSDADIDDWFATVQREQGPPLIRAGRAARDWMNRAGLNPANPTGIFFAACLWREKNRSPIPLPFWSAPEIYHHKLDLHFGLQWIADFLECVAAAAHIGLAELERLRRAEEKSAAHFPHQALATEGCDDCRYSCADHHDTRLGRHAPYHPASCARSAPAAVRSRGDPGSNRPRLLAGL